MSVRATMPPTPHQKPIPKGWPGCSGPLLELPVRLGPYMAEAAVDPLESDGL
jgi:hypothetical protein